MECSKVCVSCQVEKPLSDYRFNGIYYSKACLDCYNAKRRVNRANDPNYLPFKREYDREWKENNPERARAKDAARYAREPERRRQLAREARARNPLREKAHYVVRRAVTKEIFPPAWTQVCERCQEAQAVEWHHHLGYEEEFHLFVIAVCKQCHGKEHRMKS